MMIIMISNPTKENYYATIIDIQPDNFINLLLPNLELQNYPEDLLIPAGETIVLKGQQMTITPPFGIDKLLSIFSKSPNMGVSIQQVLSRAQTRSAFVSDSFRLRFKQELTWIIQGQPSDYFKECYFSISDMVILPATAKATGSIPTTTSGKASTRFDLKMASVLAETCENIKDSQNLYIQYPLLSFIQPLQAGFTRGIEDAHEATTRSFVLKGTATAMKGISKITVNGEPVLIRKLTEQQFYWEKEVQLVNGSNLFKLTGFATEGKSNCEIITLNYDQSKNEVKTDGKNYLFIIGINEYVSWPKLDAARTDASDVENLLTSGFQFNKVLTHRLFDENATKENIDSVFRLLISQLTRADNLVVYYAGHGVKDKQVNEGYWIPVDGRLKKSIDYISNSEIKKYLEAFKAMHVLIIADACFSASFFKTTRGEKLETDLERAPSKWLFCSGREEVADKLTGYKNSPFTHHFIQTMKRATGAISTSELFQKVRKNVSNDSNQIPEAGPVANTGDEGGEFVFRKK